MKAEPHTTWEREFDAEKSAREPYKTISGEIFVDVGANIGVWAVDLKDHFQSIYCFEPNPIAFALLKENTKDIPHVTCIPAAVGEKNGSTKLNQGVEGTAHSSILSEHPNGCPLGEPIEVAMIALDTYFAELGKIDLLKIDTEGYSEKVEKGGLKVIERDHPALYIEH